MGYTSIMKQGMKCMNCAWVLDILKFYRRASICGPYDKMAKKVLHVDYISCCKHLCVACI